MDTVVKPRYNTECLFRYTQQRPLTITISIFNKNNADSTFSKKLAYGTHLIIKGITGFIVNGTTGSSLFVSATLADEILITKGYFQKHYLTSATFKGSLIYPITTNLITTFPNYSVPIYLTSTAVIVGLAYYGTDFLNYQENLQAIQINLTPNIRVIDPNILSNNFKNDSKNEIKDVNPRILNLIEAYINSSFINYTGNDGNTYSYRTLMLL
ncbi:hypothetical protein [Rickettsia japonica]|uniref:hypothetical protein n=1 Tax=Rickettsia japonica TaxID=35790 RepID=UPI000681132B|nr:hypothetical protein [Rickettsia japonica]